MPFPEPLPDSGTPAAPVAPCAEGFRPAPSGTGCDPVLPSAACPAGTRARLGDEGCSPIGWTSCGAGFRRDPSGWGCLEILPASACLGATRPALGSTACVPIGDCAAPFPPAAATLFVDAAGRSDATHFLTVGDALAAAPSGAVIAVEAGTYVESLLFTGAVTLVGRCAEQVILQGSGDPQAGLRQGRPIVTAVRGVTVKGHQIGVVVGAGTLRLEDCLLEANRTSAVLVGGPGAAVSLTRCVVRDSIPLDGETYGKGLEVFGGARLELIDSAVTGHRGLGLHLYEAGTTASLTGTLVGELAFTSDGLDGRAALVGPGSRLELRGSVLRRNRTYGLSVEGTALLAGSVVRDTLPALDGSAGHGIEVAPGGSVELSSSALAGNHEVALHLAGAKATARVTGCTIARTEPTTAGMGGQGIAVEAGAELVLTGSALVDNRTAGVSLLGEDARPSTISESLIQRTRPSLKTGRSAGILIDHGRKLILEGATFTSNAEVAVYVEGSLEAHRLLVQDTLPNGAGNNGVGVAVNYGGALSLDRALVEGSRTAGIEIINPGTAASLVDVVVRHTLPQQSDGRFGHALVAEGRAEGGPQVSLTRCRLSGSLFGVGLLLAAASARVLSCVIDGNAVGMHLQQGSTLRVLEALPDVPGSLEVAVSADTVFVGNVSRLGTGELPLPPSAAPR